MHAHYLRTVNFCICVVLRSEYDQPLGAPKSAATQTSKGVFTRTFESGTVVSLDVYKHTSHIEWHTRASDAVDVVDK